MIRSFKLNIRHAILPCKAYGSVLDAVAGVEFECSVVEYPSFIANLPTLQEPHYVLYTADTDEATQQPWCSDCQQADPIVEEVIKQTGGTLLKVKVSFQATCM